MTWSELGGWLSQNLTVEQHDKPVIVVINGKPIEVALAMTGKQDMCYRDQPCLIPSE